MGKINKKEQEIVRKKIESLRKSDKDQYEFLRNHEKPHSRRDFIGLGLLSGFSYLALPSLLSQNSFAQNMLDCGAANSTSSKPPAFFQIHLQGGACLGGSCVPSGKNGAPLSPAGYEKFGYSASAIPNADNTKNTLGIPMHEGSSFYKAIMERIQLSEQEMSGKFQGMTLAVQTENDTVNNNLGALQLINAINGNGSLTGMIGTETQKNGIRTKSAGQDPESSTRISSVNSVRQLVDLGPIKTRLSDNQAKKLLDSIKLASERKIASFKEKSVSSQLKKSISCGYQNANKSIFEKSQDEIIVQQGDAISLAFGNNLNGQTQTHAHITKLNLQNNSSCAGINLSGYDYHNRRLTQSTGGIAKKADAGKLVGNILQSAINLGVAVNIVLTSDGSASSIDGPTTSQNQVIGGVPVGAGFLASAKEDSTTSIMVVLSYSPSGFESPIASHTQIGAYTSTGRVDRDASSVSTDETKAIIAVAANYLALQGKLTPQSLSKACKAVGLENPYNTEEKLSEIKVLSKMT